MRMSVLVLASGLTLNTSCSDDESNGESCSLPDKPRFEVNATILQRNASHASCPEEVPAGLSSEDLENQGLCVHEVSDCVIHVDCEASGFVVEGRLGERDGNLVGRVEVTKPVQCVYEVSGKFL